jgi:hypothetical protein
MGRITDDLGTTLPAALPVAQDGALLIAAMVGRAAGCAERGA